MGSTQGPASPSGASVILDDGHLRAGPGRVHALDGLRGLALVAVLAYHVAPTAVPGGFLGVESFFVLSGFLLTTLLVAEHRRHGTVALGAYAERRVRRIAPALVVLVTAVLVVGPVLAPDDAHRLGGDVLASLAGATNWHLIADASSYFDQAGRPSLLRHLWSIAVEIQFYAVCPFLVAWLCRRRHAVAVGTLAVGVASSAVAMALLFESDDPSRAYFGTDARVGALLGGALLALVLAGAERGATIAGVESRTPPAVVSFRVAVALGPLALATLVALFVFAGDRSRWSYPGAFLATQVATAGLIITAVHAGPLARVLGGRVLRWLGVRSFGIYLWHWPAVVLLRPGIDVGWSPLVAGATGIAVAVALGSLSYQVVERPLLRRVRPAPAAPAATRPRAAATATALVFAVALGALLLRLPTTDPLSETLRAGEDILAAQPPPTAMPSTTAEPPPVPPTVAPPARVVTTIIPAPEVAETVPAIAVPATAVPAPVVVTPPPPAPAPPPPPAVVPAGVTVRAIGDSVMVSAAGALQERLGPSGYIDAQLSRQFADGIAVARGIREQGGANVVVVHLGNNGPVQPGDVDALMAELAEVPAVLLVNVRVSAAWRDSVNQTLADAAGRHPRSRLVDWYGASSGHADWFQSDGTHFRTTSGPGANAFADLIAGAIPPPPPPPTTAPPATAPPTTTATTTPPRPPTTSTSPTGSSPFALPTTTRPGG